MRFTKMHGLGNDYVYVDCFVETVPDPAGVARMVSDRHFGIGSDGLILIMPSERADVRMRIFNPDGSEAEMCGNGLRCVAKYVYDHGICRNNPLVVETGAGLLSVGLFTGADGLVDRVRVDMGAPRLKRGDIPMLGDPADAPVISIPLAVDGGTFSVTCVSMGNPHCVIFVDDVESFPVGMWGPRIENHPLFPRRTNVEFVQILSRSEVRQRTWERGAGETLACGTGASAVCAAGVLNGLTERRILNHLRGGTLELEWSDVGNLYMTGPATEVFSGTITI